MRIDHLLVKTLLEEEKGRAPNSSEISKKQGELEQLFQKAGAPLDLKLETIFQLRCALLVLRQNPEAKIQSRKNIFDQYVNAYLTERFTSPESEEGKDCLVVYQTIANYLDEKKQVVITEQKIEKFFPENKEYVMSLLKTIVGNKIQPLFLCRSDHQYGFFQSKDLVGYFVASIIPAEAQEAKAGDAKPHTSQPETSKIMSVSERTDFITQNFKHFVRFISIFNIKEEQAFIFNYASPPESVNQFFNDFRRTSEQSTEKLPGIYNDLETKLVATYFDIDNWIKKNPQNPQMSYLEHFLYRLKLVIEALYQQEMPNRDFPLTDHVKNIASSEVKPFRDSVKKPMRAWQDLPLPTTHVIFIIQKEIKEIQARIDERKKEHSQIDFQLKISEITYTAGLKALATSSEFADDKTREAAIQFYTEQQNPLQLVMRIKFGELLDQIKSLTEKLAQLEKKQEELTAVVSPSSTASTVSTAASSTNSLLTSSVATFSLPPKETSTNPPKKDDSPKIPIQNIK